MQFAEPQRILISFGGSRPLAHEAVGLVQWTTDRLVITVKRLTDVPLANYQGAAETIGIQIDTDDGRTVALGSGQALGDHGSDGLHVVLILSGQVVCVSR